jgi:hypothetical protein
MVTWYLFALGSFAVLVAGPMVPKGLSRVSPPRAQLIDARRRLRLGFDREGAARTASRALTAATVLVGVFMAVVLLYFVGLVVWAALLGSSQSFG